MHKRCLFTVITNYKQNINCHLQVLELTHCTYLGLPYITTLPTVNIRASSDGMVIE